MDSKSYTMMAQYADDMGCVVVAFTLDANALIGDDAQDTRGTAILLNPDSGHITGWRFSFFQGNVLMVRID